MGLGDTEATKDLAGACSVRRNLGFLPRVLGSHRRLLSGGMTELDFRNLILESFLEVDLAGEGGKTGGQEAREGTEAGIWGQRLWAWVGSG